jgi:hypothetical protein
VANSKNQAITAIRNIALENMIAESLHRSGWELIYRATSKDQLERVLLTNPDAILIAAEDFLPRKAGSEQKIIWVTTSIGEYELQTELRNLAQDSVQTPTSLPLLTTQVTVVTAVDSGIGSSTLAMNLAYESAKSGSKTLLLDLNPINPFLSRYFDIQHINRTFAPTSCGFTIGEISDISEGVAMAQEADGYSHVVIDLGRTPSVHRVISGQRIHESLARWSLQSAERLFLLARGEESSIANLKKISEGFNSLVPAIVMRNVFISRAATSARERRHFIEAAKSCLNGEVHLLSRDVRNLSKAAIERRPLAPSASKSPLAREIAELYRQSMTRER